MRISSNIFFMQQLQVLTKNISDLNELQLKGMKNQSILNAYEDPVLSRQILEKNQNIKYLDNYTKNIVSASNRYILFDSTIKESVDLVSKISTSLKNVLGDTSSDLDREKVATELEGYLSSLLSKANTQDANGQYVFSGYQVNSKSFILNGSNYSYQGSNNAMSVDLTSSMSVTMADSGYNVFDNISMGNGHFTIKSNPANQGTASTTAGNIVSPSDAISEDYTIKFVTKSSGKMGYEISGSQSGVIVPQAPNDYPDYVPNSDISFNNISFHVTGVPKENDEFTISKSKKDNVFNFLADAISTLKTKTNNDPAQRAFINQKLNQAVSSIDQVFNHLVTYQSQIGVRSQLIQEQDGLIKTASINEKAALKDLSEPDLVELINKTTQQKTLVDTTLQFYKQMEDIMTDMLKNF